MPKVKKTDKKIKEEKVSKEKPKRKKVKKAEKEVEKKVKKKVEKKEKVPAKESKEKEIERKAKIKPSRYIESIGRRKTSVARIRIWTRGDKEVLINGKPCEKYFSTIGLQGTAKSSLEKMNCLDKFRVQILVKGGGIYSQAEAIRHGIARALVEFNPDFKKRLRKAGFLTRDPRMRERKKFGLKRARRAPQWRKR